MDHRRTHPQETAAAKAGISERSARRIDRDPTSNELGGFATYWMCWRTWEDLVVVDMEGSDHEAAQADYAR
jgi:hypothetical protein